MSAALSEAQRAPASANASRGEAPGRGPEPSPGGGMIVSAIHVLLVDDHPVVREGLRTMLMGEPGIEVVGEASSADEAVRKVGELDPDVVLMDIRMPGVNGIEATRSIKKAHPTTAVIMLTISDSEIYVVEAIRAGAAGYLTKDCSGELLCHGIKAVADGGTLFRSRLLRRAVQGLFRTHRKGEEEEEEGTVLVERLSPRELEVLHLAAQGYSNKQVARVLNLAEVTVKKHFQSVVAKLGASDRTHAVITAFRLGLIE